MDSVKTKLNPPKHHKPEIVSKMTNTSHNTHITNREKGYNENVGGGVAKHSIPNRGKGKMTSRYQAGSASV